MYMLTFMFNDKESVQFPCTNCPSAFYTLPFLRSDGIVERFHHPLKVSLHAQLAGSDCFHHLHLVLLDLQSVTREDSSISLSEAVFGSPIVLPCEFLDSPELPSPEYLQWIQQITKNNPVAPPHHNISSSMFSSSSLLQSTHFLVR